MLFTELRFLPFFLVAFAVHWLLRSAAWRKAWLLVCSYAFYAAWDWRFLSLIVVSTLVDYVVGLRLGDERARRRPWLLLSLAVNLGLLGFFKYFGFFVGSAADLIRFLGFEAHEPTLAIVLPVGISFYTFQTLSYSIDVYRRRLAPTRSLLDLGLFVAFFPQLVAGPIVRAADFLPQLRVPRMLARTDVRAAAMLFLAGFVKKACVSDNLARVVDHYFASPADFDVLSAWTATLCYAVQIYCDFSGYSDMAIACAALLGYRLCLNFDFPYFARDIADFWRRWHISLSSWLRDYLYIPLGGNRGSRFATYRNLLLTMLLGGLWHGAAWNFVIWGGLHGTALAVHRLWRGWRAPAARRDAAGRDRPHPLVRWLSPLLTFYVVCVGWIFFRAVGFENGWTVLRAFVLFDAPGTDSLGRFTILVVPALALAHWIAYRRLGHGLWRSAPRWAFAFGYGCAVAVAFAFVATNAQPFIYFQF